MKYCLPTTYRDNKQVQELIRSNGFNWFLMKTTRFNQKELIKVNCNQYFDFGFHNKMKVKGTGIKSLEMVTK